MAHDNTAKFCTKHRVYHSGQFGCPSCMKDTYRETSGTSNVPCIKEDRSVPRYKDSTPHQKDMLDAIDAMERQAAHLVNEGRTIDNGRRISLATTNLEQGFMWLRKAVMKADKED